jgi:hypothetical protein
MKTSRISPRRVFSVCLFALILTGTGCAFTNQQVSLEYNPYGRFTGGSGRIEIARPVQQHRLQVDGDGRIIIGTVRNTFGMHTANVVTGDDIGDWIALALEAELRPAGYFVDFVDTLTNRTAKGIRILVQHVFVNQMPGFWIVGAKTTIKLIAELVQNGRHVATLQEEGFWETGSAFGSAGSKEKSLRKGLENCLDKLVPRIISVLR